MRTLLTAATVVAAVLVGASLGRSSPAPPAVDEAGRQAPAPQPPASPTPPDEVPPLLQPAAHGDGDSWKDTAGTEYRLGLVNAPEQDECFGTEATEERRRQVAAGFRAEIYAVDGYGRGVSVVHTAGGSNLNLHLARNGFVDDRYLADFRHENPSLAAELDAAFAEARAEGRGLWSACAPGREGAPPAPAAAPAGCHPDDVTCMAVAGDGSGTGGANDLDCGDVQGALYERGSRAWTPTGWADGEGIGCDS